MPNRSGGTTRTEARDEPALGAAPDASWDPSARLPSAIAIALAALLLVLAYRPLWSVLASDGEGRLLEGWLFTPGSGLRLPAVATASWLLWRRRERIRRLAPDSAVLSASLLAAAGAGGMAFAYRHLAPDALLISLGLETLALGAATRGLPGLRAVLGPTVVLLLGLRLPAAFENELVWHLQLWTTRDAAALSNALGRGVSAAGVMLWRDRIGFQVIEACSGYQTARILLLSAVLAREIAPHSRPRLLALLAGAPLLAYLLNVVRVSIIVAGEHTRPIAASADDHTLQGIGVMIVGSAALCVAAWALSRGAPHTSGPIPGRDRLASSRAQGCAHTRARQWAAGVFVAASASLLLISVGVQPLPEASRPHPIAVARSHSGWTSEPMPASGTDLFFLGELPWERVVHRRYRPNAGPELHVDLFVSADDPSAPATGRLFTSRLAMPGPDWAIRETRTLWLSFLETEVEESVVVRERAGAATALAYTWRVRDRSAWQETWRRFRLKLLGGSPERPRVAVRIATPFVAGDPLSRARARKVLDHFAHAFREDLSTL